jgi:tetratricopeptide (TPR) repeat protein
MGVPTRFSSQNAAALTLSTFVKIASFLLIVSSLGACATQKSREKPSAFNRFYHNTTAYYNGFFNANVIYEESKMALAQASKDNYVNVLSVYDYVNADSPEAIASEADRAIEKLSVVVALHRQSVWTDDSYLLVGKLQSLKRDFESAEETMEYFREEFSPEAMAERKKNLNRKTRAKARAKERDIARKERDIERKIRKKEADQKRKERVKEIEQSRKERQKDAKKRQKERQKELKKQQQQRQKEAKARAKARKKGKKPPPRQARVPTPAAGDGSEVDAEDPLTADLPATPSTPQPEPQTPDPEPEEEDFDDYTPVPEKPKSPNYLLKHRPCYAEGLLWLGRVYTERQMYNEALRAFEDALAEPSASKAVLREVPVAQAHLFLKQKRYDAAVPYLQLSIQRANKRKLKARYMYILAQIYQQSGRMAEATELFRKVRKLRPGYEMDFNARLNKVTAAWLAGKTTPAQALDELRKMLKDKKNTEYKDRIHYTLAQVYLTQQDTTQAIASLNDALGAGGSEAQRKEAHLQLAELYYSQEKYVEAKFFYDKALESLTDEDERYARVFRLSKNLTDIAINLQTITLQDSLLRVASLSEKELIAWAEDVKAQKVARMLEAQQPGGPAKKGSAPGMEAINVSGPMPTRGGPGGVAPSTFFAYDDKARDRGMRDFRRFWGDRPLTDNWRQVSKARSFQIEDIEEAEESIETSLTKSELQALLDGLPLEDEARLEAIGLIEDAMLALGRLYREKLEYPRKSVDILDTLLTRYPETRHELDAWYFLHLAYKELGNIAMATHYYDLILGKYPETTYARILRDPNYLGEALEKERRLNAYYQQTYDLFHAGQHQTVRQRLIEADTLFEKDNRLQTKFALLKAMNTGSLEGKEAYIAALKDLVAKFPDTEEEKRAKEILRLLGDTSVAPKELTGMEGKDSQFDLDPNGVHYIIINWNINKVKLEDAQQAVNNFNRDYFKAAKLRLSSNIFLDIDVPLMVVRKFDSAEKAMEYYRLTQKYAKDFIGGANADLRVYPVTQQNYRVILKSRSLDAYDPFFKANYK